MERESAEHVPHPPGGALEPLFVLREQVESPVLTWLPVLLGFAAAAWIAWQLCPAPRAPTLSVFGVLRLSVEYVLAIVCAGSIALMGSSYLAGRRNGSKIRRMTVPFWGAAAWLAPAATFWTRESIWCLVAAGFAAISGAAFLHQCNFETNAGEDSTRHPRLAAMIGAALLLQLTLVCATTGMARAAALLVSVAMFVVAWYRRAALPLRPPSAYSVAAAFRSLAACGFSFLLVAASLSPYLVRQTALEALLGEEGADEPVLHAPRQSKEGSEIAIAPGDSYPGMILRPEGRQFVKLVPPSPTRRVFDGNLIEHKKDPVSIPFYGAYWFFRTSDETLPADAVESRGDPAATSFRTTDFTPIAMEARQNFGVLIDLSCCREIEVFISNGDRRPGTVSVEMIVVNTRLAGSPRLSLGILPVQSTQRWHPGDDRPPVSEALHYRIPAKPTIARFDEAILRFELRSPRTIWSAKIAIDRFRLLPRLL